MVAPVVVSAIVTFCAEVNVPAAGENVGVAAVGVGVGVGDGEPPDDPPPQPMSSLMLPVASMARMMALYHLFFERRLRKPITPAIPPSSVGHPRMALSETSDDRWVAGCVFVFNVGVAGGAMNAEDDGAAFPKRRRPGKDCKEPVVTAAVILARRFDAGA